MYFFISDDLNQCKIYQSWVLKAIQTWESNNIKPCQGVITFTLKLVGLVSQNELQFQNWDRDDVYNKLCKLFELQKSDLSASIKIAYITMLCNLTEHHSGREWIIKTGIVYIV